MSDIKVDLISKKYKKTKVLSNITFQGDRGDCIGFVGGNGCGKSTLLSILAGITKPDGGSAEFFGQSVLSKKSVIPAICGYIPQDNPLLETLSVRDNLKLWGGSAFGQDNTILDQLGLQDLLKKPVSKLSGGMKRRLTIACGAMHNQPVLIMDEPTTALDIFHKSRIHGYMMDYVKGGNILLLATHEEQEMRMCTKLYYMSKGMLTKIDDVTQVEEIMTKEQEQMA